MAPSTLEYSPSATTGLSGGGAGGAGGAGGEDRVGEDAQPAGGLWGLRSAMVGRQQQAEGVRERWAEAQRKLATAKQRSEGLRRHREKLLASKKRVEAQCATTARQAQLLARDVQARQAVGEPG